MKNTFAVAATDSNLFSRKWGTIRSSVEPYMSGTHFIWFSYLPSSLETVVSKNGPNSVMRKGEIRNLLSSLCNSVTIPGATVNRAEFNGLGNIRWGAPTNVDWDNTVTCRYLELSGLPIHSIMHGWVKMIRDSRTGSSMLTSTVGDGQYDKSNYAATAYYWTAEPNGVRVEFHSCLTGMFPLKDPTDQFGHDLTSIDKMEIDIDWNVDYIWQEDWTYQTCSNLATRFYNAYNRINNYAGNLSGDGQAN